jgi:hypothetical protein
MGEEYSPRGAESTEEDRYREKHEINPDLSSLCLVFPSVLSAPRGEYSFLARRGAANCGTGGVGLK